MAIIPYVLRRIGSGDNNPDIETFDVTASASITAGNFVVATSGLLANAVAATTGTIVGLSNFTLANGGSATTTKNYPVVLAKNAVIRMNFTNAGTKKTFTAADLYGTQFGLSDAVTLNPDDTTGGFLQVVGYDNTKLTVDVVVASAAQYLV
ncbi:hypothetical protein KIH86_23940 [Paenibacillus sp. HN-1]|uniref:hypothetical protein n=1 Tax=Paenibacillus TaxID=44249 RepID=UPI001CA91A52|nr:MULTISPECIES: hypothetical protein [Paenibacillus]MBY9081203.1 hypothetical protein [Paenibacillus sp. CGMCC 1.18879]MBY9087240.1 hypothetical protein [Paenibacillus sinensis]